MPPPTALKTRYLGASPAAYDETTEVKYFVDGETYFRAIRDAIADTVSGDAVYILGWLLNPTLNLYGGATPPTLPTLIEIGDLLADRRSKGVDVRIIVNGAQWIGATEFASYSSNWVAVTDLRARVPPGATAPPLKDWVVYDWSGAERSGSQHQKAFVISHGGVLTAYLGGMDFNPLHMDSAPHNARSISAPTGGTVSWGWHDAGVRLVGGAAIEVWHNFGDRWQEACTLPPAPLLVRNGITGSFTFAPVLYTPPPYVPIASPPGPSTPPTATPDTSVQVLVSRYLTKLDRPGMTDAWLTRGGGEILEVENALTTAIGAAQRYIYVEDQFLGDHPVLSVLGHRVPDLVDKLNWLNLDLIADWRLREHSLFPHFQAALGRGVKLIFVGSGYADPGDAFKGPKNLELTPQLADLTATNPANLAVWRLEGTTVHSKLILIDDEFAAVGSANLQSRSMLGIDSELHTALVTTGELVKNLRMDLWREHLGVTASLPAVEAALANETLALGMWRSAWATGGMWFTSGNPSGFAPATMGSGGVRTRAVRAYVGPGVAP